MCIGTIKIYWSTRNIEQMSFRQHPEFGGKCIWSFFKSSQNHRLPVSTTNKTDLPSYQICKIRLEHIKPGYKHLRNRTTCDKHISSSSSIAIVCNRSVSRCVGWTVRWENYMLTEKKKQQHRHKISRAISYFATKLFALPWLLRALNKVYKILELWVSMDCWVLLYIHSNTYCCVLGVADIAVTVVGWCLLFAAKAKKLPWYFRFSANCLNNWYFC